MKESGKDQRKRNNITEGAKSLFRKVCKYQGKHDPLRLDGAFEDLLYALKDYLDKEYS